MEVSFIVEANDLESIIMVSTFLFTYSITYSITFLFILLWRYI